MGYTFRDPPEILGAFGLARTTNIHNPTAYQKWTITAPNLCGLFSTTKLSPSWMLRSSNCPTV
jgi:hypothetical protein